MTTNHSTFGVSKYLLLGIAVLSLTFCGCPPVYPPTTGTDTSTSTDNKPEDDQDDETDQGSKRETVSATAAERIMPHRKFSGQFATAGRGEDAKWGINKTLNFQYLVTVIAESNVLSKETTESGYVKVEEIRTFHSVTDNLVASDVDIRLCLDTLPIETISNVVKVLSSLTGSVVLVSAAEDYITKYLKQIDGTSLRDLWGLTGIEIPKEVEDYINKFASAQVLQAIGGVRDISGKSYKFTWYQKESGEPLYFKYSYENGTDVTDERELMVLKRVNTFIDYYLAPDKDCKPGDSWSVSADNLQEAFDPYVDGTYVGSIGVKRIEDEGSDWKLVLIPSEIRVRSENNTTGELKVEKGYAKLEPKSVTLKELFAEGTANLRKISKHHLLFTARIQGDCQFQGRLVSEEVSEGENFSANSNSSPAL